MRICSTCKECKPLTEFAFKNRSKGTYQALCNPCRKSYQQAAYANNSTKVKKRSRLNGMKKVSAFYSWKATLKCQCCQENVSECLDFHHINGDDKEFAVSVMVSAAAKQTIIDELNKCACLCANCHRKEHAGKLNKSFVALNVTLDDIWPT